jgi:hypothetical protein
MLTDGKSTSGGLSHAMTAEMNYVDLILPAQGAAIPRNHGYAMYGAVPPRRVGVCAATSFATEGEL